MQENKTQQVGKMLTYTILSFSLLTIMSAAAVAPALGLIKEHFSDADPLLVKLIISLPPLFIIIVNLLFTKICKYVRTRTLALTGVLMYVIFGTCAFWVDNIWLLLVMRALLGISVGLIMPLSVGLLSYYFPPEEIARLMGLSAAMNQMGGVVATLIAGVLATIDWNYAFLVYILGLIVAVMVVKWLPNEQLHPGRAYKEEAKKVEPGISDQQAYELSHDIGTWVMMRRFHPSLVGMLLCTITFFVFVSNFAMVEGATFSMFEVTCIMVGSDLIAAITGMMFGRVMGLMPVQTKYLSPLFFIVGFSMLAFIPSPLVAIIATAIIGMGNGIGVPYLNTIASIKGGRNSVTTIMPLISAALFLGQFVSPIIVGALAAAIFPDNMRGAYDVAIIMAVIYLLQIIATRHFQSLPPRR